MAVVSQQQLENAAVDCQTIEDIVNGPVGNTVTTRLGQEVKTFTTIQAQLDAVFNEAEASASAAATSETNAGEYATAAADSATAAATSESNAADSATTAGEAKTEAEAARDLAEQYRDEAQLLAQTGDYLPFSGLLTLNQALGTAPIILPGDPKIPGRVTPFVLGAAAYQRPGLDFTVGKPGVDTDTTHLYIVGGSADLQNVEYAGTVQLPSSLTNINAVSAGGVNEVAMQDGIVSYLKMKASALATTAADIINDALKLVTAAGLIDYVGQSGRIIQSAAYVFSDPAAFTGGGITLKSWNFTPRKSSSKLRVTYHISYGGSAQGSDIRIKLQRNGVDVVGSKIITLYLGNTAGYLQRMSHAVEFDAVTNLEQAISLFANTNSGTGYVNRTGPNAGDANVATAEFISSIVIEEIAA